MFLVFRSPPFLGFPEKYTQVFYQQKFSPLGIPWVVFDHRRWRLNIQAVRHHQAAEEKNHLGGFGAIKKRAGPWLFP